MSAASNLFFSTNMEDESLYSRITPTNEHTEYLREQWNPLADHLIRDLALQSGYSIKTWLQGSYKYGTMIRPIGKHEEYDVDLGVYFCWNSEEVAQPAPEQLKTWVQASLKLYAKDNAEISQVESPPKERCGRVKYKNQFHIDIPAYHLEESSDTRRLATESSGWEDSDPKSIYVWFKGQIGNPERAQLRRLIRYLKAWAALQFKDKPTARPSSILITVLASESYISLEDEILDDDYVFYAVVLDVFNRLRKNRSVLNPINASEELNRLSDDDFDTLLSKVETLSDICCRAHSCTESMDSALIWEEAFSYLFPLPPEDQSVEVVDAQSGTAVSVAPVIQVNIHDQHGAFVKTYTDEVPTVFKGMSLNFRIMNSEVIPKYATVDWVVRNEGTDASNENDLGHVQKGERLLEVTRNTSYYGRHFMDCTVRLFGQVVALKRVPVYVKDNLFLKNLPPKPWYKRYIKKR